MMIRRQWLSWQALGKGVWLWILGGVIVGGIIHILAVFAIPQLAGRNGWGRLEALSSPNQMYVLPLDRKAEIDSTLPFEAPNTGYAFCRFDLSKENAVMTAPIPERSWSAAIYSQEGDNFYLITGADAQRTQIRLLLVPRSRLAHEASTETSAQGDEQIIVITPVERGVILLRAPMRGPAFRGRILAALQNATCAPAPEEADELPLKRTPPGFPPLPERGKHPATTRSPSAQIN